ncbi:hypothetical protein E2C01_061374 [Portunus trituberculatus]|uniref:Uncharacterized protein n=1 Tax=Portunus trituberculatus TaxID=210409 RepID=A0A5B7HB43_PORTR|nr:hypothetical protein [Portunus trituberculatus]
MSGQRATQGGKVTAIKGKKVERLMENCLRIKKLLLGLYTLWQVRPLLGPPPGLTSLQQWMKKNPGIGCKVKVVSESLEIVPRKPVSTTTGTSANTPSASSKLHQQALTPPGSPGRRAAQW